MLDPEIQERIVKNNKQISELLQENETLLKQAGYNPPIKNVAFSQNELIQFPNGYIRTTGTFSEKYHLRSIFPLLYSRQNVTYALEVSDLMNYIVNRINIWGPVKTVFYKLAIVNLVSVMEAIILEAANNICKHASQCKHVKSCPKHLSKKQRSYVQNALDALVQLDVLNFDTLKLKRVNEIINYRNRIHIRLTHGSELQLDDFNMTLYNEVVLLLQDVDEQIFQKGVPLYECNPLL